MDAGAFLTGELLPTLNRGLGLSALIIVPSGLLGLAMGVAIGGGRAVGPRWLRRLLDAYVSIFRGTPLVVQLTMWYFGLPNVSRWLEGLLAPHGWPPIFWRIFMLSPYAAAVTAFALCSAAYHSEYVRGAVLSVRRGQWLAAESLGFTRSQAFWHVIAPMALRRAVPGCSNELIYLIKYSSLAMLVTIRELTGQANALASLHFRHLECYLAVAGYYLALVSLATWALRLLERRLAIPGHEPDRG
jgi:polar amino acid transport system permease protein